MTPLAKATALAVQLQDRRDFLKRMCSAEVYEKCVNKRKEVLRAIMRKDGTDIMDAALIKERGP